MSGSERVGEARRKLGEDPGHLNSLLVLAGFSLRLGRVPDALEILSRALDQHPDSPEAHDLAAAAHAAGDNAALARRHGDLAATLLLKRNFAACDLAVISFPKSGRTWLRAMCGKAVEGMFGLSEPPMLSPDEWESQSWPRIYFSHANAPNDTGRIADVPEEMFTRPKPLVLLVRDPRDVVVSNYFHMTRRTGALPSSLPLAEFVMDEGHGLPTVLAFMRYWEGNLPRIPHARVIRYEDLHDSPASALTGIFAALNLAPSEEVVADAVSFSSYDNMRRREREGASAHMQTRTATPWDPDSYKTRRGTVGGHADDMPAALLGRVNEMIGECDGELFGYRDYPVRP